MNGKCEFEEIEGTCSQPVIPQEGDPRSEVCCPKHNGFGYRVCMGCGGGAVRECGHEDPHASPQVCRAAVCNLCQHEGQGHAPAGPPEPPKKQNALEVLRTDLEDNIRHSLEYASEHQIPVDQTCKNILSNLQMHVVFQVLSGMAANPPE